jgi:hypothetical protein
LLRHLASLGYGGAADGAGAGLALLHAALVGGKLAGIREYDGERQRNADGPTRIDRLEVQDAAERMAASPLRLVK